MSSHSETWLVWTALLSLSYALLRVFFGLPRWWVPSICQWKSICEAYYPRYGGKCPSYHHLCFLTMEAMHGWEVLVRISSLLTWSLQLIQQRQLCSKVARRFFCSVVSLSHSKFLHGKFSLYKPLPSILLPPHKAPSSIPRSYTKVWLFIPIIYEWLLIHKDRLIRIEAF